METKQKTATNSVWIRSGYADWFFHKCRKMEWFLEWLNLWIRSYVNRIVQLTFKGDILMDIHRYFCQILEFNSSFFCQLTPSNKTLKSFLTHHIWGRKGSSPKRIEIDKGKHHFLFKKTSKVSLRILSIESLEKIIKYDKWQWKLINHLCT